MLSSFKNHPLAQDIEHARHHQYMREMLQHLAGGIFSAFLVWLLFNNQLSEEVQWYWLLVNLTLFTVSVLTYAVYFFSHERLNTWQWGVMIVITTWIWGIGWAFAPHIFLQTENPVYILSLIAILIGLCTSPSITMALYPLAYVAFITPVLLSLGIHLNQLKFGQSIIVKLLPAIFWAFLVAYAFNLHKVMIRSIRLQLENTRALNAAENANLSKSKFLASASHDLRQPLQAVNLFASALENQLKDKDNQTLFDNLQKSINSMSDLLSSLLDISKLDAQAIDVNQRNIALRPLLDKLYEAYAPQAQKKNLEFRYAPANVSVLSDPILLERIVSNLLSNAIRYTSQGSIGLSIRLLGDKVEIIISDTGEGVPESEKQAIFKEFHQLNNPERNKEKGLGLGLAIVKRLCELLGHHISITSIVGQGSKFHIGLPCGSVRQCEEPIEHRTGQWDLQSLRVLVIDDEQSIRLGLESLMSQWGCEVKSYESSASAIAGIRKWRPQLIISDYRLQANQTGSEAIASLLHHWSIDVSAILITGDTDPERIKEARASGFTLLHKPVKPAQLRTAIQHLCND